MQIIPSILVTSQSEFEKQVSAIHQTVPMIHIDIADGSFVPATTWADPAWVAAHLTIECELHLMVQNPLKFIEQWQQVPQVRRIFFPCTDFENSQKIINAIHGQNCTAGMSFGPTDPIIIPPEIIGQLDAVMCMGVHPGIQNQQLIPSVLEKLSAFKKNNPQIFVELDGGVKLHNLSAISDAGADAVTPGSAIFHTPFTPAENVANFVQESAKIIHKQ
jgi:ribulose-phosphate 3-epimerase